MKFTIRLATLDDAPAIRALIETSSRTLALEDYSAEQIELALTSAWGLDTQLIIDQSYFVVEVSAIDKIIGCGGWSFRQTLFGNDTEQNRDPEIIDVASGAAKIRAFFVDKDYSRRGVGTMILQQCEAEAISAGYKKFELMATLPGLKLYQRHGYQVQHSIDYRLNERLSIEFVAMEKTPQLPQ